MQLEKKTDEELLELIRKGDQIAEECLYQRYKQIVRAKVRPYFLIGADHEDLVQEGMIGLYKAVCDYRADRNASFRSFADLCITRQMITAIKRASRKKHSPLNTYVSLNSPISETDSDKTLMDLIANLGVSDPEEMFIRQENFENISVHINSVLSKLERTVLRLYLEGLSYQQIAMRIDKPTKAIDNAIQRVKKKLEKALQ
ncbi:MAG: RNA polymerase sporulation sigma factor SigH [Eubacteriales bacterium]|nr:RNA polymerase sporulation sigma factor SigH [Eubacteriales bacterium]